MSRFRPRSQQPRRTILLTYTAMVFFALVFFEATRLYIYLIYVLPLYTILLAVWLQSLLASKRWLRALALTITVGWCLFTLATIAYRARLNAYSNAYARAAQYLREHVQPKVVFAGGEFGPPVGFDHVLDDIYLGYRNHKQPDYIVVDSAWDDWYAEQAGPRPEVYRYIQQTLAEHPLVYESHAGPTYYRVYARRARAPAAMPHIAALAIAPGWWG